LEKRLERAHPLDHQPDSDNIQADLVQTLREIQIINLFKKKLTLFTKYIHL